MAEGPPACRSGFRWTQMTSAAAFSERDGAGAATYNGKMYLLGGWADDPGGGGFHIGYNDVWSSTNGANWTLVRPNTPGDASVWEGRHTAGYVVFNNKMWVVGGDPLNGYYTPPLYQGHYQPDVWSSNDGVNWTQATANAPWGQRCLTYTTVHDGKIWVMGGQTVPQFVPGVAEAFYNDVWNSADGVNWTQVTASAPWLPRGAIQGSVEFNGRMWLLGGGTYDTPDHPTRLYYNDVWSSADGVNWTQATAHAPWAGREYQSVGVFDDKMWVMAGFSGDNRNDVWYSSDGVNWTELPDTPWANRHAATLFIYDNHMYIAAGSAPSPMNDVWRLDKIPEPATAGSLVCAGLSVMAYAWRRRTPRSLSPLLQVQPACPASIRARGHNRRSLDRGTY
jgi:hypothetical protein